MRLRRKPWIDEAIHEYDSHIILSGLEIRIRGYK